MFASPEVALITLYEVDGKRYMAVKPDKWFRYQTHIRQEKRDKDESRPPAPPGSRPLPLPNEEPGEGQSFASERAFAKACASGREGARADAPESANARNRAPYARVRLSPSPSPAPSGTPSPAAASAGTVAPRAQAPPGPVPQPAALPSIAAADSLREPEESLETSPVAATGLPDADRGLVDALTGAGLNRGDALRLAASDPKECRRQLDYLPRYDPPRTNPGGHLREAIEGGSPRRRAGMRRKGAASRPRSAPHGGGASGARGRAANAAGGSGAGGGTRSHRSARLGGDHP
jgi:hypothetical protein